MGMLYDGYANEDSVWGVRDRTPGEIARDQAYMAWRLTPEGVKTRRQDARITIRRSLVGKYSTWSTIQRRLKVHANRKLYFPEGLLSSLIAQVGADPLDAEDVISDVIFKLGRYSDRSKMARSDCIAWFPDQQMVTCNLEEFTELVNTLVSTILEK